MSIVKTDASIYNTAVNILNNDYVFVIIAILVFSFGQRVAPNPPDQLINLFSKDYIRVLFLSLLLVFRFENRPTIAIIIALFFVYILQHIYVKEVAETVNTIKHVKEIRK
jgi:hypothetical protein